MKVKLYSIVPTAYQHNSITQLMGGDAVKKCANGSYYAERIFQTIKEAREWMRERIEYLYSDEPTQIKDNIGKDWMRYDAATAHIEKLKKH